MRLSDGTPKTEIAIAEARLKTKLYAGLQKQLWIAFGITHRKNTVNWAAGHQQCTGATRPCLNNKTCASLCMHTTNLQRGQKCNLSCCYYADAGNPGQSTSTSQRLPSPWDMPRDKPAVNTAHQSMCWAACVPYSAKKSRMSRLASPWATFVVSCGMKSLFQQSLVTNDKEGKSAAQQQEVTLEDHTELEGISGVYPCSTSWRPQA